MVEKRVGCREGQRAQSVHSGAFWGGTIPCVVCCLRTPTHHPLTWVEGGQQAHESVQLVARHQVGLRCWVRGGGADAGA